MKLDELLTERDICPDLQAKDKIDVLKSLVDMLAHRWDDIDKDSVLKILLQREKLGSTGTGNGIAIPHGKVDSLSNLRICFGRCKKGVDFDSIDQKPVHLFFLLIAPADSIGTHLSVLARISNLLNDDKVRQSLLDARDASEIYQIIVGGGKSA